ncbi:MAG: DegV family protein [Acidimicrobiales bacterium]
MTVAVLTDSAAAIPNALASQMGITKISMRLTVGGEAYDEDDISLEEVVRRFDEGIQTAGPSPGRLAQAIGSALGATDGDGVVVLTVSERMSSTYKSACLAAVDLKGVVVLDTHSAAAGQSLVVMAAARAALDGCCLEEVVARSRLVRDRVRLVAAVETLDYLVKGGRLPDMAGRAGRHLGVRPLFEFRADGIRALRPALSHDKALDALLAHWRRSRPGKDPDLHVAVSHALDAEAARYLAEAIRAEAQPLSCLVESFSPVMVAHTGPGVIGLAWHWEARAGDSQAGCPTR